MAEEIKVRCLKCDKLKLRDNPKMAALGFGNCAHRPGWESYSVDFPRDCVRYRPADEKTVQARVDWYEKRSNKT